MNLIRSIPLASAALACLASILPAHAQWQSQSFKLKPGWNAVFLHVDASHALLDDIIGADPSNPVAEVWMWRPSSSPDRIIDNPQQPSSSSDWGVWDRSATADSLTSFVPNRAYLVRNSGTSDYTLTVKGVPALPSYEWTTKGVNFVSFSTPEINPPLFANFLTPVPRLASEGQFYRYDDTNNDLSPSLFNGLFNSTRVVRGQAYWVRHKDNFNRYFSAFDVLLQGTDRIRFREGTGQYGFRLRNNTESTLRVTLASLPSEAPPSGQRPISGPVPLLIRGDLSTTTLTYAHRDLTQPYEVSLAPAGKVGSEVEVVLGLNRSALAGNPGDTAASILRLTDSLGFSQIDVGISAEKQGNTGLWVGNASITDVGHYLKSYQRDGKGQLVTTALTEKGQSYIATGTNTSLGKAARAFPLRLIVHNDDQGRHTLLQRVYHGANMSSNTVLATREVGVLHPQLISQARRISAPHLPWAASNPGWTSVDGDFQIGTNLVFKVGLDANDQASNPFLHTYHPDHDNLDATFSSVQSRGAESYEIQRTIELNFADGGTDFTSLTSAGNQISGSYVEEIRILGKESDQRTIHTQGSFVLNRITSIPTLTR